LIEALYARIGPIKTRDRGHTSTQMLVGMLRRGAHPTTTKQPSLRGHDQAPLPLI